MVLRRAVCVDEGEGEWSEENVVNLRSVEGQRQSDDGYDVSATSATAARGTHRMSQLNIIESGAGRGLVVVC